MSSLRVALVQKCASLDPAENRDALSALSGTVEADTGLLVLPEAYMRDFGPADSDLGRWAEPLDGPFVARLTDLAAEHGTTVVAGMFEVSHDPDRPFNTLAVVDADGLRASYRKIHLDDSFGYRESDRLSPGPLEPVLVDVGGVRLGLMTCYDLRFPELARELVSRGAELLVVPSAWVAGPGKTQHWRTLAVARAIENTAYVAAAGQPGPRYTGHSLIVGPAGDVVAEVRAQNPSLLNRRL